MNGAPRGVYHGLCEISAIVNALYDHFPRILTAPAATKMPHVALTLWVHCYHKIDRTLALNSAWRALSVHEVELDYIRRDEFIKELVVGATSPKQIARATLRDLRARENVRETLSTVFDILSLLRPSIPLAYPMTAPYQRRLLQGCLAACQSLLCMPEHAPLASCEGTLDTAFLLLQASLKTPGNYPGLFPERRIHAVIALASTFLLEAVDSQAERFVAETRGVVQIFYDQLRRHAAAHDPTSPSHHQLDLLRRASRAHWKRVMDGLRARGAHHQTWMLFGRALEVDAHGTAPVEHDEVRATFPLLTRCAWRECLCSVHEPHHKLQACRGCSHVAYCNDRCQRRDWTDGGHSEDCAKRPVRRVRKLTYYPDQETIIANFNPLIL